MREGRTPMPRTLVSSLVPLLAAASLGLSGCGQGSSPEEAGAAPAEQELIPAERFARRAEEVATALPVPEGYDLRVDLIEPTIIHPEDLDFSMRFRAVCVWSHYAVEAGDGRAPEPWAAAVARVRDLTAVTSFSVGDGMDAFVQSLVDALEQQRAPQVRDFLQANCTGMGLAGFP